MPHELAFEFLVGSTVLRGEEYLPEINEQMRKFDVVGMEELRERCRFGKSSHD